MLSQLHDITAVIISGLPQRCVPSLLWMSMDMICSGIIVRGSAAQPVLPLSSCTIKQVLLSTVFVSNDYTPNQEKLGVVRHQ